MPTKTIHCRICGKSISGYDFAERMKKLRRHRKEKHPGAHKASVKKSQATRRKKLDPAEWERTQEEELYSPAERRHKELTTRKKLIANPQVTGYVDAKTNWAVIRVLYRRNAPALPEFAMKAISGTMELHDGLQAAGFTDEGRGKWVLRTNKFNIFVYI